MKKIIPFISPIVFGLLGGLLIECVLCAFSIVVSPFADTEETSFFAFLCIISFLLALFLVITVVVNIVYLTNQNNKHIKKITIIAEILAGILLFIISWNLSESVVKGLYNLF